jgi:hypothetical protein
MGDPFSAAAVANVYADRQRIEHATARSRIRALAPADDQRPAAPAPAPAVGWPDPTEVYERRRLDVLRAQRRSGQ